jgi:ABC-type multidrug transport system fused ATPase/permease subunit
VYNHCHFSTGRLTIKHWKTSASQYGPAKSSASAVKAEGKPPTLFTGQVLISFSGKSSLMLALFRMLELNSGTILVDGVDISTVPRNDIRSPLNAISQDPYFVAGSIRLNLDPYSTSTDAIIISALHKVQLLNTITSNGGLDTELDPYSLSHGQRQLFCLARAVLRKSRIVVLDEATSSVDRKTDELMQRIIVDRIAVLDRGRLVECDSPATLLATESAFKELYDVYSSSKEVRDD